MSIEAMKQALDALEQHGTPLLNHEDAYSSSLNALRQAIAEAEKQEPKREWVGLTDEEIHEADRLAQISHRVHRCNVQENTMAATDSFSWHFVHFINAKLREKNK
jgi:hypothetical protein